MAITCQKILCIDFRVYGDWYSRETSCSLKLCGPKILIKNEKSFAKCEASGNNVNKFGENYIAIDRLLFVTDANHWEMFVKNCRKYFKTDENLVLRLESLRNPRNPKGLHPTSFVYWNPGTKLQQLVNV